MASRGSANRLATAPAAMPPTSTDAVPPSAAVAVVVLPLEPIDPVQALAVMRASSTETALRALRARIGMLGDQQGECHVRELDRTRISGESVRPPSAEREQVVQMVCTS